jgi:hypothetical protein
MAVLNVSGRVGAWAGGVIRHALVRASLDRRRPAMAQPGRPVSRLRPRLRNVTENLPLINATQPTIGNIGARTSAMIIVFS